MITLFRTLAVAAVTLTATAAVAGEATKSFTHDGVTYVYHATPAVDGGIILTGYTTDTGARFRLVVKDGRVTGDANRHSVSFSVAGSRGAADGAVPAAANTRLASAD